jgi:UDP-N-acetylglucosamine 1-carboxyvinyltransferase
VTRFLIKGLNGNKKLSGSLPVRGAKNSVLKALASSILFKQGLEIHNVPYIQDVSRMRDLLLKLGYEIDKLGKRAFKLRSPKGFKTSLDNEIAKTFRSSIVLSGPLLAREGKVIFPHPGGCVIGARPIDVFLESFKKMGAQTRSDGNFYVVSAKRLKGADIFFKLPSVTATETLMMAACLAKGTTRLYNAACEPEILFLADFLNASGANIKGAGTHTIIIKGVPQLNKGVFNTPPDRIEAGSLAVIAALCGKEMKITNCDPRYMGAIIHALESAGVSVDIKKTSLGIKSSLKLRPVDIKTREYPGFPTDLQAPFSVLLTQANGRSKIFETVFEGRLNYLNDLVRMGAEVVICDPHRAIVDGPSKLRGREMESPDLRAGLSFLAAALIAKGDSVIHNANYIDRGYERIEDRLNTVGAEIRRIKD